MVLKSHNEIKFKINWFEISFEKLRMVEITLNKLIFKNHIKNIFEIILKKTNDSWISLK